MTATITPEVASLSEARAHAEAGQRQARDIRLERGAGQDLADPDPCHDVGGNGAETIVFFTFWGLFPLVRKDAGITGQNWMQKMLAVMNKGGTGHLKLSKMNFAGMGPAMMKSLANKNGLASPKELLEAAIEMGVKLIPCQMTMDMMGLPSRRPHRRIGGASGRNHRALLEAQGANTLFI